jgi:hypothetical protein
LKNGADVNARADKDETPLHKAATGGHFHTLKILLEHGARVNSRDKSGRTALHIACLFPSEQSAKILLEYGSDINIMCDSGKLVLDMITDYIHDLYHFNHFEKMKTNMHIIYHIIKMKAANLYLCQRNEIYHEEMSFIKSYLDLIGYIDFYEDEGDFWDRCEVELANMKRKKIVNSTISFYDIFSKGERSLAAYMRNENVMEVSNTLNYEIEFPLYASMLKRNFRKGMKRNELLESANRSLNGYAKLPYICAEKILRYLSNEDLRNVINVFEPNCVS